MERAVVRLKTKTAPKVSSAQKADVVDSVVRTAHLWRTTIVAILFAADKMVCVHCVIVAAWPTVMLTAKTLQHVPRVAVVLSRTPVVLRRVTKTVSNLFFVESKGRALRIRGVVSSPTIEEHWGTQRRTR